MRTIAGASLCLLFALPVFAAETKVLHRSRIQDVIAQATPVGRLSESRRMNLAIGLPLRDPAGLAEFLRQLYDPGNPNYHRYLTPAEFTERFGPTEQDYQAVADWAESKGLRVTVTHPNRVVLDVEGAVPDIEKALHVNLRTYKHPREARNFYAPDGQPSLDLNVPVLDITGLDDYELPHPRHKILSESQASKTFPKSGSGTNGSYRGSDFRAAYVPGTSLTGSGQNVGLLQFDGYYTNDIATYISQAGISTGVTLTNVAIDGGVSTPGSGNGEVCLDIEMVIAMAPGVSKIFVYEAPNPSPWVDLLSRMANDNLAKQLSCSWGGGGPDPTAEQIFQQMAAQGQSFFNATGDSDAFIGPIEFPSDSVNITEVGGTTLNTTGPVGSYISETVWNWGNVNGNYVGSSGGISTTYGIPNYQKSVSMAFNQGSTTMRNVPDVALTGDNVYVTYHNGSTASSGIFGGTSCAAPLWAGFMALVNQQAAANGLPSAGFINPTVYAIGLGTNYISTFHDTTTGNNEWPSSPTQFSGVTGYDLCTGWGTPNGTNLINALLTGSVPYLISAGSLISGGNGNGVIDANECNLLYLPIKNLGSRTATAINAVLTTATPGVTIIQPTSTYSNLSRGPMGTNLTAFKISTSPSFVCGNPISLSLALSYAEGAITNTIVMASCQCSTQVVGSLTGSDPTQTGRLTRDGTASACEAAKSCPGYNTPGGGRAYDSYTFTNSGSGPICITAALSNSCSGNIFAVAYLDSFNPASLCSSYLADMGTSPNPSGTFSFSAPAFSKFVIVAHVINVSSTCSSYTLNVTGIVCPTDGGGQCPVAPVALFTGTPTNGTPPLTVGFTNLSSGATNYSWNFGDGTSSSGTNPVKVYTNAGTYTVSLTAVGAGGTNTLIRTNYIVVTNPAPVAANFSGTPTNGQAPLTVTFTNLSTGATNYNWAFGDGSSSSATNPVKIYTNAGTYTVTLTSIGAGGSNTLIRTNYIVVTNPPPVVANFSGSPTNGQAPLTVNFTNLSSGATNYSWNFGDGNSSATANPTKIYTNAGAFTVSLTAIGAGGTNTLTRTNYILATNPAPVVANFSATPTNGLAPLTVTFTNLSSGATNYNWNFGDGNSSAAANPAKSYTNAGNYTVSLTAIGAGGTNTFTRTNYIIVTNLPPAVANFTGNPTNGLAPLTVAFTNLSSEATNYSWDFGDGNISTTVSPSNVYTNPGTYTVSLTAVGPGGTNVLTRTNYIVVTNLPPPVADFVGSPTNGLAPLTVAFTNLSSGATNYNWNFGDGDSSAVINPIKNYTNAGNYTVSLIVIGGGGTNTFTRTNYIVVTNLPPVMADFTGSPTNGLAPLTVAFTNLSTDATNYSWDFGDGNTSTAVSPTNVYTNAGTYTVSLTAIGPGGTNALTRINYVVVTNLPPAVADFTGGPTNGLASLAVTFTNLSTGATDYAWDFGDGNTSAAINPINVYTNAGTYTVSLTATGEGGTNILTRTNYIVVTNLPPAVADFTGGPTNGLAPLAVTFTNLSTGATDYAWDFGDGNTSAAVNPTNVYTNAGIYTVSLTALGEGGTNSLTRTNYIIVTNALVPPPIVDFAADTTNGVVPLTVTFTNLSSGATNFGWDFGDGNSSVAVNPTNIYTNAGSYIVTLTAIGAGGTNRLSRTNYIVATNPPPVVADFMGSPTNGFAPLSVVFTNLSSGATAFNWSFGDGNTSTDPNPVNIYTNIGSYAVSLTSMGAGGTNSLTLTNYIIVTSPGISAFPPTIFSPGQDGDSFTFSFMTLAGKSYTVEYTDSLDGPSWQTLQTLPGDGSVKTITVSITTASQRFYRLSVQ